MKAATIVLGILGLGLGLLNWRTTHQFGVHKLSETELDALLTGLGQEEHDQAYRNFLQNIRKEKLISLAFGHPVPLREVGRLMVYYERGFATIEQVRLAWPHRNSHQSPLSFALERAGKIQLWLAASYSGLCFVAGAGLALLMLLLPWKTWNASMAATVASYFVLGWLNFHFHRGLFVAHSLSRRERLGGDSALIEAPATGPS